MGRDWDQFGPPPVEGAWRPAPRRRLLALLVGIGAASIPAVGWSAEHGTAAFGDLALRWDRAVWSILPGEEGFKAYCLTRTCTGREVVGTVAPGSSCERPAAMADQAVAATIVRSGPLEWRIATWWLGCRNAHPQSVDACAIHGGRAYRVSAPLASCRTGPGRGATQEILRLIEAVRP